MKATTKKCSALLAAALICVFTGLVGFASDDVPPDWPDENDYHQGTQPGSYIAGGADAAREDEEYQEIIDSVGESTRNVSNSPALGSRRVRVSDQVASYGVSMTPALQLEGDTGGAVIASSALSNIAKAIAGADAAIPAEKPAAAGNAAPSADKTANTVAQGTANDHPSTGAGTAALSLVSCGLAALGLGTTKQNKQA